MWYLPDLLYNTPLCVCIPLTFFLNFKTTVEPPNNGHMGDEHFFPLLEVVLGGINAGANSLSIVQRLSLLQR